MAERPACCGGCKESLGVVANDVCSHYLHQRCFNEYAHCQTPSGAPVAALCPVENCRKPIGIALSLPGNCLDTVPIIGENNLLKQLMQEKDVRITTLEHETRRLIELSILKTALNNEESYLASLHSSMLTGPNRQANDIAECLNYMGKTMSPYVVLSCGFYEMRNISGQEENYKRIRNLLAVLIQNGVKKLILIPTVLGDDENHLQRRRKFRQFLQGEAREINTQYPDVVVKYLSCLEPIFDRSPFGTDGNGNPFIGFKTSLEAILHIMPLLNSRYTNRGG